MFRGATLVNLDSKGRLSVPTRYREQLLENAAGQMVCTIDIYHPCLLLYPLPEWEIIEQKLSRLSSMNPVERRVQRLLLGHASECQMDGAGRLLSRASTAATCRADKRSDAGWTVQQV